MSKGIVVLVLLALLAVACDRDDAATSTQSQPAATTNSRSPNPGATTTAAVGPAAEPSNAIADHSLPADKYIELGLPSYDRTWSGPEMTAAANALRSIAATSPQQLPRLDSRRSGAVFARIIAQDNLDFFRSRSLPLASRFPVALEYIESLNGIVKLYLSAFMSRHVAGDDLIELMGAVLRTVRVELELVDEFLPTISKDDPKYDVRMDGLNRMRQGLGGVVNGAITTLTEDQAYSAETRGKLLAHCRESFPHIVPKLSKPSQAEVQNRLRELVDDPRTSSMRSELILLRDEVNDAAKHGGA